MARKPARKNKSERKVPAAPPPRGTSDRDKAVDALTALLSEHPFEQIGLAEVAGRAGIKLSALRAEFGSTLAIYAAHIKDIDNIVLDGGDELRSRQPLGWSQMRAGLSADPPIRADVERAFELLADFTLQQGARIAGGSLESVAGLAVHCGRYPLSPVTHWTSTFLPAAINSTHRSRRPASAASSCSSVSTPPLK